MDEARVAMATFQKLKDEDADESRQRMKKSVLQGDAEPVAAPVDSPTPQP
jgi:hypothetical protein